MIVLERMGVRYADAAVPTLSEVSLVVEEGELALVVGRTGSGKSTLLRTLNGLVPHFSGGTLYGRVVVAGRDTARFRPRELADVVGFVGQDPQAGFVTDRVEDELAYGLESLAVAAPVMRKRVEETLDLLGLAGLRHRALADLSGGERQRVAIGSVLTMHPRVLVLDEPTSALDPQAAEEVLATLQRLVHDLALTVVVAEHRLERVVQYADRLIHLPGAGRPVVSGDPRQVMGSCDLAPPVVELGRWAGWRPLPLSIRDARRAAAPLRSQLQGTRPPRRGAAPARPGAECARIEGLVVRYGDTFALRGVDLVTRRGEITAVMGRNGAGKSTLLAAAVGLVDARAGHVDVAGVDPGRTNPRKLLHTVGLVPQDPADLLYGESVAAECSQADADAGAPRGSCRERFAELAPGVPDEQHPRDLSEGQRLALVLAIVLTGRPLQLLLDEPTRGLDYTAKRRLAAALRDLAARGHAVVLATHDVELVAEIADRVVVLADGEVVSDGPTDEVLVASPAFAPQVTKVLGAGPWLTVSDVTTALGAAS